MTHTSKFEKVSKHFSILCIGFFGLLAQALLFRFFLSVFDGNELSIGLFFFSWLIWVCIGAWLAKRQFISKLAKYFYILIILYLPLYLLQQYLFTNAQTLLGGTSFELVSLNLLIPFVLFCNAPVSFMTGFLFVLGTEWIKESSVPVVQIYIYESLGSFIGALAVTLLLFAGYTEEPIFLVATFIVLLSVLPHVFFKSGFINRFSRPIILVLMAFAVLMLFTGYSQKWNNYNNRIEWRNYLNQGKYEGSFFTPQAKYLYGTYRGEFVVTAWNSTYESLPNTEVSSRIVGEYLSQNPKAEKVLVIGPGSFSICRTFNKFSQIKEVVWLDTDSDYSKYLLKIMPEEFRVNTFDIKTSKYDIRKYIQKTNSKFDLIVLNLPNPSTLLLNRYFTLEFFQQLKRITTQNGVIGINFPAGANYMGTELSFMGGSLLFTLRQVYDHIVLKPGDVSCFFAATHKDIVSDIGTVLEKRLNGIKGIRNIFNPENIRSVFETNRIAFQIKRYNKVIEQYPSEMFLNTDKNPKSFLFTLLFTIKKLGGTGFSISKLNMLLQVVFPVMILILFIYFLLRCFYYRRAYSYCKRRYVHVESDTSDPISKNESGQVYYYGRKNLIQTKYITEQSNTDLYFAVFATAILGLGINLILIFLFQIYLGSVFIYFGLITALFMFGLFVGGLAVEKLFNISLHLSGNKNRLAHIKEPIDSLKLNRKCSPSSEHSASSNKSRLAYISVLYLFYILLIYLYPPEFSKVYFSILFLCAGLFCGPYFALAAFSLKKQGVDEIHASSRLEIIDNLGGAVGSVLCSIVLLPILGINKTLIVMFFILGVIFLHSLFLKGRIHTKTPKFVNLARTIGFFMLGIALIFIIALALFRNKEITSKSASTTWALNNQQILDLAVKGYKLVSKIKETNGISYAYYIVKDKNQIVGYIFRTKDYSKDIQGYAGPIHMLSYVKADGKIQNFTILDSNETPTYLNELLKSKDIFLGQNVFVNPEKYQINAVTGATITSSSISKILLDAGSKFSEKILGDKEQIGFKAAKDIKMSIDKSMLLPLCILILFSLAAIILRYKQSYSKTLRFCFLTTMLVVLGIGFNLQYSTAQIFSLVAFRLYLTYFNTFLFLCLIIPILIVIFGNIYCGYLCPFGAFQELLHNIVNLVLNKLGILSKKASINRTAWRFGSSLKYIILFFLVILFVLTLDKNIAKGTDILPYIFGFIYPSKKAIVFIIALIIISLIYKRFWCRVLCPSGAFLSLFNAIRITIGMPIVVPKHKIQISKCDLGISTQKDIDCICCDNCHKTKSTDENNVSRKKSTLSVYNYLFLVLAIITFLCMMLQIYQNYNKPKVSGIESNLKPFAQEQHVLETKKMAKPIKFSKKAPAIKSIGSPRNIDIQKYKSYINEGHLSDKEAMYYMRYDNVLSY